MTQKTGQSHRYIVELPGRLSEHTLNTTIRCLRSFGRWLVKNGWLRRSPFEGLGESGRTQAAQEGALGGRGQSAVREGQRRD